MKQLAYRLYFAVNKSPRHEAKFSDYLLNAIRPGDCIWDVGANIGYYTQLFADRVGSSGRVVAFEPFADSFDQLRSNTSRFPQVQCMKAALGAANHTVNVEPLAPGSTANNVWQEAETDGSELISIRTGAKVMREGCTPPTILKIDVEGFEEEVLWGFRESLRDTDCRAVFIEVHFSVLDQRGFLRTPSRLVSLLKDLGYKTRWIDRSHLEGARAWVRPRKSIEGKTWHTTT